MPMPSTIAKSKRPVRAVFIAEEGACDCECEGPEKGEEGAVSEEEEGVRLVCECVCECECDDDDTGAVRAMSCSKLTRRCLSVEFSPDRVMSCEDSVWLRSLSSWICCSRVFMYAFLRSRDSWAEALLRIKRFWRFESPTSSSWAAGESTAESSLV